MLILTSIFISTISTFQHVVFTNVIYQCLLLIISLKLTIYVSTFQQYKRVPIIQRPSCVETRNWNATTFQQLVFTSNSIAYLSSNTDICLMLKAIYICQWSQTISSLHVETLKLYISLFQQNIIALINMLKCLYRNEYKYFKFINSLSSQNNTYLDRYILRFE